MGQVEAEDEVARVFLTLDGSKHALNKCDWVRKLVEKETLLQCELLVSFEDSCARSLVVGGQVKIGVRNALHKSVYQSWISKYGLFERLGIRRSSDEALLDNLAATSATVHVLNFGDYFQEDLLGKLYGEPIYGHLFGLCIEKQPSHDSIQKYYRFCLFFWRTVV